jgi:hypothetical protein
MCRFLPVKLLLKAVAAFRKIVWPAFWLYLAQSTLQFVIERCTQRLTNACAIHIELLSFCVARVRAIVGAPVGKAARLRGSETSHSSADLCLRTRSSQRIVWLL